jgi:ADP-ribosyl-[dinitrogen reductase] hydrolase
VNEMPASPRPCRILQATAIGDAVGAGYEFVDRSLTRGFILEHGFRQHGLYSEIAPGMFTDDTLMSYGVAITLVEWFLLEGFLPVPEARWPKRTPPGRNRLAQSFLTVHGRHPGKGYSKHVEEMLDRARDGAEFCRLFEETYRSDSNGGTMRSAVYGVIPDLDFALECAREGAGITHQGWGVHGSEAVAAVSHYAVHRIGPRRDLNRWLADRIQPVWTTRYRERIESRNGPLGLITVLAALTVVRESASLREVLERSIRLGGDVDSVAAIAMGLAVSFDDIADDLPAEFWNTAVRPVSDLSMAELAEADAELTRIAGLDPTPAL